MLEQELFHLGHEAIIIARMQRVEVKTPHNAAIRIAIFLCSTLLFSMTGILLSLRGTPGLDRDLSTALHSLVTPLLTAVMRAVTWTGEPIAAGFTALLVVWFWLNGRRATSVLFFFCVTGGAIANELLKRLFTRARPDLFPPLAQEIGFSFPSGHTTTAAAPYGLCAVLLFRSGHRIAALLSLIWVLLVGASRIYLAVHWPSDVLGSLLFGTAWLTIAVSIYDWRLARSLAPGES
jgi:undecaprenyl-diphosphatase